MRVFSTRAILIGGAAAITTMLPTMAAAQQRTFHLPRQSASRSIPEFARQAGIHIVAPGQRLAEITTPPLTGQHDIRRALRRLLAGSGLAIVADSGSTITLANVRARQHIARYERQPVGTGPGAPSPQQQPEQTPALAPAAASASDTPAGADIVVTGSRVARTAVATSSPVTTLSDKRILNSGVANIGDLLMQTPSVSVGEGSRNSTQVFLNLRGLGTNRTLVVVDGRRRVSGSATSSAVDLSVYPTALIDRVEIVTGGASAIYGADAVTGAVNVILKKDFEGLQANGRIGMTDEGSSRDYLASVLAGGRFADGRGSVSVGVAYQKVEPLQALERGFFRDNGDIILSSNAKNTGPADGIFDQLVYTDAVFPTYAYQGAFTLGGRRYVVDNGQLRPTQHDAIPLGALGAIAQGGDGYNNVDFDYLRRDVRTISAIGRLGYDVTDGVRLFGDFEYSNRRANSPGVGDFDLGSTIRIDNPFVPTALRDLMTANGVQQVTVTRSSRDQGVRSDRIDADVLTLAGGIEGQFANGWDYAAFVQHGSYRQTTRTTGRRIAARYAEAIDVIAGANGQPVCRSVTARAAGCLPVNILGETVSSDAALNYFRPVLQTSFEQTQNLAGAQLKGDLFRLPAGAVKAAAGVEWRKEKLQRQDDALTLSGAILFLNGVRPISAGFDVKEAFGEIVVPVLADQPFAKSLEIEGAVRASDYDTIGSTVAWKLGANWAFNDTIRVRGSVARSVRAPNLFELYNPGILGTIGALQDPCTSALINASANRTANCRAAGVPVGYIDPTIGSTKSLLTGGNPDLREETSRSYTAGVILSPGFLPGLIWTTDWWRIRINDATSTIDPQTALYGCYDAASLDNVLCSLFERGGRDLIGNGNANSITLVRQNVINVGRLDAEGIDTQIGYIHRLGANGRLELLFNGTWLLRNELLGRIDDPKTLLVEDGEVSSPRFRGTVQSNYSNGPWSLGAIGRFISAAKADQQASAEFRDQNDATARFYLDLNLGYRLSETVSLFGGVNNVTRAEPPVLPEAVGAARSGLYDALGRVLFLGGAVRF